MKVVVGGGTGFIGQALVRSLIADGHGAVVLTRDPRKATGVGRPVSWDAAAEEIDGADAVVNLAGIPIGGPRWTTARKEAIRSSRVDTTRSLVEAIAAAPTRPSVLVNASGIGYYGDCGDAIVDESSPAGSDFMARISVEWEAAAAAAPVRHVVVRTPVVIGRAAHAVRLMALPYRLFVGGPVGSGRQYFPWIHLDDLVEVYRLALTDETLSGPVNAVAGEQLRQREAARAFGAVLHRPSLLPAPAVALRLLMGEQADLLLHGQRAVTHLLDGFAWRYTELRAALADALA